MRIRTGLGLLCISLIAIVSLPAEPRPELEKRAAEIVPLLSEAPVSFGAPITERAVWEKIAAGADGKRILAKAEEFLKTDPLPLPDSLFLDYSRTGKRASWEDSFGRNRERQKILTLAECLENKGRFLPALEKVIALFCSLKTWEKPAHDARLDNFHGRRADIDLESSSLAFELALVLRLLPLKLAAGTGSLVRRNIEQRVLAPYRDMVYGCTGENGWMRAEHNWNAVCHAGVIGAALALPLPAFERACHIAAAEQYLPYYLKGFTEDGYCGEGVGYWNYGFGHYIVLAEAIFRATGGKIDFLAGPKVRKIAEYGFGIELAPGVSPAFADVGPRDAPEQRIQRFLKRRLGLPEGISSKPKDDSLSGALQLALFFLFPNSADRSPAPVKNDPAALSTAFPDAGVFVCRPAAGGSLSAAFKAGRNSGNHSHNDTGSYVAAVDGDPVLVDPGAEVYSARTFSARRFESRLINSWGHPVPVVAGKLQMTGPEAAAQVEHRTEKPDSDLILMDLRACYQVSGLKSLRRAFRFTRSGGECLAIEDAVEFEKPESFETALVTYGSVRSVSKNELLVFGLRGAVRVIIKTEGADFAVKTEPIDEETRTGTKPTRIGITLDLPVKKASIFVDIQSWRPENAGLILNGGFEYGAWGWVFGRNGMGRIERGRAAEGDYALLIQDDSTVDGSSVYSTPVKVEEQTAYVLNGRVFLADGADCGVYAKFYDKDGRLIGAGEDQLNIAPKSRTAELKGKFTPFAFEFTTPAGCAETAVWIHSYNAARVTLWLDELVLEKSEK